jgi:signal transduction histidine kinase
MLKHGSITYCIARLRATSHCVYFELLDDGIAFDFMIACKHTNGSGLKNIQSRLQSITAQLEQNKVDKGNHYIITLTI